MRIRLNNEKREKLFRVARNHRMNDLTDTNQIYLNKQKKMLLMICPNFLT